MGGAASGVARKRAVNGFGQLWVRRTEDVVLLGKLPLRSDGARESERPPLGVHAQS